MGKDAKRYIRVVCKKAENQSRFFTSDEDKADEDKNVLRYTMMADSIYIPIAVAEHYMTKWCHRERKAKDALAAFDFDRLLAVQRDLYLVKLKYIDSDIGAAENNLNLLKRKRDAAQSLMETCRDEWRAKRRRVNSENNDHED